MVSETNSCLQAQTSDISLVLNVSSDLSDVTVCIDEHKFSQVLSNVLSNALKFTPRGGEVTVMASTRSNGVVSLSVLDNGVGMSQVMLRTSADIAMLNASVFFRYQENVRNLFRGVVQLSRGRLKHGAGAGWSLHSKSYFAHVE